MYTNFTRRIGTRWTRLVSTILQQNSNSANAHELRIITITQGFSRVMTRPADRVRRSSKSDGLGRVGSGRTQDPTRPGPTRPAIVYMIREQPCNPPAARIPCVSQQHTLSCYCVRRSRCFPPYIRSSGNECVSFFVPLHAGYFLHPIGTFT